MKKYSLFFLFFVWSFCTVVFAQFKPKDVHKWSESHNIPANLKVGDEITLNFSCKMNDGFHIYAANQPGAKSPIKPLIFQLDKSAKGVEPIGKVIDGAGNKKTEFDDIFRADITFYEKTATFSQKVKITAENPILAAYLDYQICDEGMCIPSTYEFTIPLKVGAGGSATPPPATNPNPTVAPKEAKGDFPPPAPMPVAKVMPKDTLAPAQSKEVAISPEEQNSILSGVRWAVLSNPNPTTAPKVGDILTIVMKATLEPSIQLVANGSLPSFELAQGQSSGFEEVGDIKIEGKKKTIKGKTVYEDSVTITQQVKITAENPVFKGLLNFSAASNNKEVAGQIEVIPDFAWAKGTPDTETLSPKEPVQEGCNMWELILKGLIAGIGAVLTPCFYPMIPLTVSYFTKQSGSRRRGIFNALFYGLSIIGIFTILALGLSFIFGNTVLHSIATNPWVNLALFALIFAFGLSFLGWFDMSLPSSWSTKLSSKASTTSLTGIFFMALTLVVVSFSCTGVFVAQLMGAVGDGGSWWCVLIPMLAFSTTLAIPFVLFAVFPSLLQSIPKSGGWLGTFKISLGFLEIALAFSYLSNADLVWNLHILPRELYLSIWIAIALALSLYLLGFLKIDNDYQPESISVPRLLLALLFLTLGFYMIPGMFNQPVKLFDAISIIPPLSAHNEPVNIGTTNKPAFSTSDICTYPNKKYDYLNEHTPQGLCAFYDLDQGLAYAKEKNMPVFLDFTGHTCKNCRTVEQNIWTDPAIKKMLQNDFVLISLFTDDGVSLEAEEISPSGRKLRTLGNKWQDYEDRVYGLSAQPYYIVLDHDKSSLITPFGYLEAPDVETYKKNLEAGLAKFKEKHGGN